MTTWVLLRGLMREARHWGEFPALLQQGMDVQSIVTLDLPGNGRLNAQVSAISVEEMANHCRAQLGLLGHKPPYFVVALSLGAMAAVEWSEKYPEEISRLVLINTSLAPLSPFYHRLRPVNYPALMLNLLFGSVVQREVLILRLTSTRIRTEQQKAELLGRWVSYARERPTARANIFRQLKAAMTHRARQAAPPVPVLLLASEHDRLVDVRCTHALGKKWGSPIHVHPTAGHDLPLDDGNWVVQQITQWMD